jgi:hypothetical protein
MRHLSACLFLILAAVALNAASASAQVISVDPLSFDFGSMKQQQTKTVFVTVTNEGAAELRLLDVKADCGCTVPTPEKDTLAPGESTRIEIQFNSKKFNGTVIKAVNITSNDPQNPQVDVIIKAEVHTPLIINPVNQRVGFTRSLQGETFTKQVTFTAMSDPKIEISADQTRQGLFEVNTINGFEGNPQVSVLEVTVPANMPAGRHRDHVRVKTSIEEFPTVDIEMQAWVSQSLTASPEQINFRYKKNFQQTVRIAPFVDGLEFKVTGAETDLPEINVEVIETIVNKETKVMLTGLPIPNTDPRVAENKGHIKGTLTIHTDQMETPVIKIPITYMVRY